MKTKKLLISLIIFINLFEISLNAKSNENDTIIDILIVAKTTGMCGTLKQMTAFQESTKMPGGDEFIARFINTEATRLGKTLPQLLNECQSSVEIYTRTMESLNFNN